MKNYEFDYEMYPDGISEEFSYERLEKLFQSKYHLLNTEVS